MNYDSLSLYNFISLAVIAVFFIGLVAGRLKLNKHRKIIAKFRQEKEAFQGQLDHSIDGIIQLNAKGDIVYANQQAVYFFQVKHEDLIGESISKICPESITQPLEEAIQNKSNVDASYPLGYHGRHTRIRVAHYKQEVDDVSCTIFLDNVDNYVKETSQLETEQRQQTRALEAADIACATIDLKGENLSMNKALSRLLQLDDLDQLTLNSFKSYLEEKDRPSWDNMLNELAKGQVGRLTCKLIIDGKPVYTDITALPDSENDETDVERARVIVQNTSLSKELELTISTLKNQNSALLKTSPLPTYILDKQQQIVDANEAFLSLFKLDLGKIRGRSIDKIECFDEHFKSAHALKNRVETKNISLLVCNTDGVSLDIDLHLRPYYKDLKHEGTIAIIEDHSELKSLKSAADAWRNKLNNVMDNSPAGIVMFDEQGNITTVNKPFSDLMQLRPQDIEKQTFYKLFNTVEQAGNVARSLSKDGHVKRFKAEIVDTTGQTLSTYAQISKTGQSEYICWFFDTETELLLQRKLDELIKYSSMPMAFVSQEGFNHLNPAACAFFDIKNQHELLGLSPFSIELNESENKANELKELVLAATQNRQVKEFSWTHHHNEQELPCEITLVPVFQGDEYVTTLFMWVDLRAINVSNKARIEAVNLRKAAEQEIEQQKKMLQDKQEQLTSRAQSLRNTQQKLAEAESNLSEKMKVIHSLKQSHEDINSHLSELQTNYEQNREALAQTEAANKALEDQLYTSSDKVKELERQRNQIAESLSYSEKQHKDAKQKLVDNEKVTQLLKEEQTKHLASLQDSQEQINNLQQSIKAKDQKINDVSGEIASLQSQLSSSGQASEKLQQQLQNQRKASEIAEQKRKELEQICAKSQTEINNKSSYVEHLQQELKNLEMLSQEQKDDMRKQNALLEKEIEQKQKQLVASEDKLTDVIKQSQKEKEEKAEQELAVARLQEELEEVEKRSAEQYAKIAESNENWKRQQLDLQSELAQKQEELNTTRAQLANTQQQTEEQKQAQTKLLKKLEAELLDVEQRALSQDEKIATTDRQWQEQQLALAKELEAKKSQLQETQQELNDHQRQVSEEKLLRQNQEEQLAQLKVELADAKSRASRQRELLAGSDAQWQSQKLEIEEQKNHLQETLEHVQQENSRIQTDLNSNLQKLQQAEKAANQSKRDEQSMQQALDAANEKADGLLAKLMQQEDQEKRLIQQVNEQQVSLQQRESNIQNLQEEQQRLSTALDTVRQEYTQSRRALDNQKGDKGKLEEQLERLEQELLFSKKQLVDKENALAEAQRHVEESAQKLEQQEHVLISTQKQELQHSQDSNTVAKFAEFADLPMPEEPAKWFDLVPYLQKQQGITSMASKLHSLIDDLMSCISDFDDAVAQDNASQIHLNTVKLVKVLESVDSEGLQDMANTLSMWGENHMTDNISINWPSSKRKLLSALKVIYSHLDIKTEQQASRA